MESLDLREYLYSDGVSLVEWFEHLPAGEVDDFLQVKFAYANGNRRELTFVPHGKRYEEIVEALKVRG